MKLVDARNDNTIWADSYDRDLSDIFTIQSEVALTIAAKLVATLSPEETKWIEAKPTDNLEAYDRYLQAKQLITHVANSAGGCDAKSLMDAILLLEQAVNLDPRFTRAYCALGKASDWLYGGYDSSLTRRG
jgi:adenylate cyclase